MKAADIIRKVTVQKFDDKSFSYTGKPDFTEERPEVVSVGPRGENKRPRTKSSVNNSYT